MHAPSGEPLVGRDDALARVSRAVDAARQGTGATLLVSGAAGMGKTALLRAALCDAYDVDLAWGTCVEAGSAPGYWPWSQALNGLVRGVGVDRARAAAGPDCGLLATLAPSLDQQQPAEESDRARMLLLDATVAWLHALGAGRPSSWSWTTCTGWTSRRSPYWKSPYGIRARHRSACSAPFATTRSRDRCTRG